MRRWKVFLVIFLVCLLLFASFSGVRYGNTSSFQARHMNTAGAGVESTLRQANWFINSTETIGNESIKEGGNVTIGSGGNLTLLNVTLTMDLQKGGEYGILVQQGGSLQIYNSRISSANNSYGFYFLVDGVNFVMRGTSLSGVGWSYQNMTGASPSLSGEGTLNGSLGLVVDSNNSLIEDDNISSDFVGLTLSGSNDRVSNNSISGSQYSSILIESVTGSGFTNDTVSGNEIHQNALFNTSMIELSSDNGMVVGGNIIENNSLTYTQVTVWASLSGISMNDAWQNTIRFNKITSSIGIWITSGSSDNIISCNSIDFFGQGMDIYDVGSSNVVEGNALIGELLREANGQVVSGGDAMDISGARNLTILNNSLTDPEDSQYLNSGVTSWSAIHPVDIFDSEILNNDISWIGSMPSLYLQDSAGNYIEGNTFNSTLTSSWTGIFFEASNNNTFMDNEVNSTSHYSIALSGSNNNFVWKNDFVSMTEVAYDDGHDNSWSYEGLGNYWGGYNGTGLYKIPPNGSDNNPLPSPVEIKKVAVSSYPFIPPPEKYAGQWVSLVVASNTTYTNDSLDYPAGSIDVKTGGILTISNSQLDLGLNSSFSTEVEDGGTFKIVDSHIIWGYGKVQIDSGATFILLNCTSEVAGLLFSGSGVALSISPRGTLIIDKSSLTSVPNGAGWAIRTNTNGGSVTVLSSILKGWTTQYDDLAAIDLPNTGNLVVKNSLLEDGPGGISIGPERWPYHMNVTIVNSTFGPMIWPFEGSANNLIFSNNTIRDSVEGLSISAQNITADNNTILESWNKGFIVTAGFTGYIGNGWGVEPGGKSFGIIGNRVSNVNYVGIYSNDSVIADNSFFDSSGWTVWGNNNTFNENTVVKSPVYFAGSGNTIYHNNFIAWSGMGQSGYNFWFHNREGNYWNTYNGSDTDQDGIGDTPFVIGNITDSFPYMQMNGWLKQISVSISTGVPGLNFSVDFHTFTTDSAGSLSLILGNSGTYNLEFPSYVPESEDNRWSFVSWKDGNSTPERTVQLNNGSVISVSYEWQSKLSLTGSNVSLSGGGWYVNGTLVNISVKTNPSFIFVGWKVEGTTSSRVSNLNVSATTVLISGPISLVALTVAVVYRVTFTESGLPAGTSWSLEIGGKSVNSTGNISINESNGTYSFTINYTLGFTPSPASGTITVNGTSITEEINFTYYLYLTGTISPSNATLYINGKLIPTTNGYFNVTIAPGTYEYKVTRPGYNTFISNATFSYHNQKLKVLNITLMKKTPLYYVIYIALIMIILLVVTGGAAAVKRRSRIKK